MNITLMLLADYANTTADNKLNVMGIFSQIYSTNFPAIHPQMYVAAQLSASPAEYGRKFKLGIKLLDPDAKELVNFENEVEVPKADYGQSAIANLVVVLANLVFENPGDYQFLLLADDDETKRHSLEVILASPPSAE